MRVLISLLSFVLLAQLFFVFESVENELSKLDVIPYNIFVFDVINSFSGRPLDKPNKMRGWGGCNPMID